MPACSARWARWRTSRHRSFQETLDVNFTANWRLIRASHPLLRMSEAGRALFVTSGVVPRPRAFWGVYAATKAALETMIACYADEIEKTPIRVNLFDPGAVRTEMRFKAMPGEDQLTLPTPQEVAATIPHYLSPEFTLHGSGSCSRSGRRRSDGSRPRSWASEAGCGWGRHRRRVGLGRSARCGSPLRLAAKTRRVHLPRLRAVEDFPLSATPTGAWGAAARSAASVERMGCERRADRRRVRA